MFLARNKSKKPLLLSVVAAVFTLVAMGGVFLAPSIIECSPGGDDIAACLIVDLNERLPVTEALTPIIGNDPAPVPVENPDGTEPDLSMDLPTLEAAPEDVFDSGLPASPGSDPQATASQENGPETPLPEAVGSGVVQQRITQSQVSQSDPVSPVSARPAIAQPDEAQATPVQTGETFSVSTPDVSSAGLGQVGKNQISALAEQNISQNRNDIIEPLEQMETEPSTPDISRQVSDATQEAMPETEVIGETLPREIWQEDGKNLQDDILREDISDTQTISENNIEEKPDNDVLDRSVRNDIQNDMLQLNGSGMTGEIAILQNQGQTFERPDPAEREVVAPEVVLETTLPSLVRNRPILLPTIDALEIDGELNFFAGAGEDGFEIRLFVDNEPVGTSIVDGGRWLVESRNVLDVNSRRIRADMFDPDSNDLLASTRVDFELEVPGAYMAPLDREAVGELLAMELPEAEIPVQASDVTRNELPVQNGDGKPADVPLQNQVWVGEKPEEEVGGINMNREDGLLSREQNDLNMFEETLPEPERFVSGQLQSSEEKNPEPDAGSTVNEQESNVETEQGEEASPIIMSIDVARSANNSPLPGENGSPSVENMPVAGENIVDPVRTIIPGQPVSDAVPFDDVLSGNVLPEAPLYENPMFPSGLIGQAPGNTPLDMERVNTERATIIGEFAMSEVDKEDLAGEIADIPDVNVTETVTNDGEETEEIIQQERSAIPILRAVTVGNPQEGRFASGKVIIRRGDNLWTIARRVYGMGRRYVEIYEANRNRISDPHWIYPGQVFDLPKIEDMSNS